MYIKNRRNSNKTKAFSSNQTLLLTEFCASKPPTFHILNVMAKLEKQYIGLKREKVKYFENQFCM
jgi:hypothetical protein